MPFSVEDESTWRVTPLNPTRELPDLALDHTRCAALHNLIIRLGWAGSSSPLLPLPQITWWAHHITTPALEEEYTLRLSPSLKLFLQTAWQVPEGNFFYYISGLNYPNELFLQDYDGEDGFLTLYRETNFCSGGHRDGLSFNQPTSLAIFQSDILDAFATRNGRMEWEPLEVVLSVWLDMIDTGKITLRPQSSPTPAKGPWEAAPWELAPYSEEQLQHAVSSFNTLILRIECLLEDPTLKTKDNQEEQIRLLEACATKLVKEGPEKNLGLVPKEVLDEAGIPEGFLQKFLLRVRRPKEGIPITYIAPGLRFPTVADFETYALKSFPIAQFCEYHTPVLPFPLFVSDMLSPADEPLLPYPFNSVSSLPYGLWMEYCDQANEHAFEDTVRLYLPFEIGSNGFALSTDDSLIGENLQDKGEQGTQRGAGRKNDLYQPGYCHFVPWHGPQLGDVLEQWGNMVGLGEWEVSVEEKGVGGGLERFKEADTEEGACKYQIFSKW